MDDFDKLMGAKFRFAYSQASMMPEIPSVEDVLYVLRVLDESKNFSMAMSNHTVYVRNVMLAAFAVSSDVLELDPFDMREAERIVAKAIVALCPEEAKCLFVQAYVNARTKMSDMVPSRVLSADALRSDCGCVECRRVTAGLSFADTPSAFAPNPFDVAPF